jgi:negative regulator of sigma E activity
MTDQINDQISAFIDNELSEDESALLVRRFERDGDARTRAMRYTLIGASLRGELLEPHPSVLRQRIAAALSGGTTAPIMPRARERWTDRWARPLLGVGIAATVAVVAIGTLRSVNEASIAPIPSTAIGAFPLQVSDSVRAPSYVVPQGTELSRTGAI